MRRRRSKRMPLGVVVVVIVLASVLGIFGGRYLAQMLGGINIVDILRPSELERRPIVRILMVGEDNTGSKKSGVHGLSDTLVVLAINNRTNPKQIRAISIPRDTRVDIPGHRTGKINAANKFGGPELARQVIQNMLGVDIHYYIATTPAGLRGLVDSVGGVYIVVDQRMYYNDRRGDLHINLRPSPEKQLLNGRDAEGYVRFRHDRWGDSGYRMVNGKKVPAGRVARQQYFMRALANRILSLPTKRERAKVLSTAYEKGFIMSDLELNDWGALADFLKDVDPEKMQMDVLPGEPGELGGGSYWLPDLQKLQTVVAKNMRFEGVVEEDMAASIEVLNGSGVPGIARRVADKLKRAGFEVTKEGNAPGFGYDRSRVITRKGHTAGILAIVKLLNCTDLREEPKIKGMPDVTVIIGRDYTEGNT